MVSCRVVMTNPKSIQHMHGIIPYMFDCLANPVVDILNPSNKELHGAIFSRSFVVKFMDERLGRFCAKFSFEK